MEHTWNDWLRRAATLIRREPRGYSLPEALAGWFSVVEVDDVERHAGELFRRCFHQPPPNYPRHYVARADSAGETRTIGYIHYTPLEQVYLCGGMCIDDRAYRRLPSEHRAALKAAGGIAELMLRHTFAALSSAQAIFGYVGDTRSERVNLRAGFRHTGRPHLIVHWPRPLPEAQQRALIAKIAAIGPF